jgi:hypothetical protein
VPRPEIEGGLADSVASWKARQRETLGPLVAGGGRRIARVA